MLYKFVGADEEEKLLDKFNRIVVGGSMWFGSALSFNDPFEFKFETVAPARDRFDAWHREHAPGRTPEALSHAWEAFQGPASDWNTNLQPRLTAVSNLYVLCLAKTCDSQLMWAHYTRDYRGFCVMLDRPAIEAYAAREDFQGAEPINYVGALPRVRLFDEPPMETIRKIAFSKSDEWAYEQEFRVVLKGPEGRPGVAAVIDPSLISGVILGSRASQALREAADAIRTARPGFKVLEVTSKPGRYALDFKDLDVAVRSMASIF
jgi:hypothetical protein